MVTLPSPLSAEIQPAAVAALSRYAAIRGKPGARPRLLCARKLSAAVYLFKRCTPHALSAAIVAVGCVAGAAVPGTGRQQRENSDCRHGARKKSVHANNLG